MFEKILIANRGEIAVRIIRACKELNIKTVAVYSEADKESMHVKMADESVCIGRAPSSDSYLRVDRIISAAEITDVDAVHPGCGFLSESVRFVEACENCGIRFIGPSSRAMGALENKAAGRDLAKKASVLVPPGSDGPVENAQEALAVAKRIGYPVMIKAVAGGEGRGIRMAHNDASLATGFQAARNEAERAFGNAAVYVEKFIENARHIEFQIFGDAKGNYIHLGERDCSLQRRNQKLIEESPSPFIEFKHKELRKKMGKAAVRIAEEAKYTGAGTIEFIVDEKGAYYYLEFSKRLQTEHPVTEEVTGLDLVKLQIQTAMGEPLKISEKSAQFQGHSIECRINAENPFDGFRPCPGRIEFYYAPGGPGVRVDSHVFAGYTVPPAYDSLIGKLIVHGKDRRDAIETMNRALGEFQIKGIKTTIAFQMLVMQDPDFRRGVYTTGFLEKLLAGARRELVQENA